ncbi:MAG: beta-lactamase family protein [bacterium]|nr:beta-lactamase family protein [bacterium]
MKNIILLGLGIALMTVSPETVRSMETGIAAQLDSLVQSMIITDNEDPIHNAALLVASPRLNWAGAAGMADGVAEPMSVDHKFKIASIGKTFTATVILQLMEERKLNLADTLAEIFTAGEVDLDSLHIHDGVAYGRLITVEQLLGQTSGIRDYMEHPDFFPDLVADPGYQWSPERIMARYFKYGMHRQAASPPGEGFEYADPNYVLLGMVIEKVTGSSLADQYRERIFEPLAMVNSYLEFYEPARGDNPLSHTFFSTVDVSQDINTSFDWAGGGIVSTCTELTKFFRALLEGQLFRKPATLELMLAAADRGFGLTDAAYGYGIMKREIQGLIFYGHGGAYDCDMFYCPTEKIGVCTVLNQMNTHGRRDKFLLGAVELLRQP